MIFAPNYLCFGCASYSITISAFMASLPTVQDIAFYGVVFIMNLEYLPNLDFVEISLMILVRVS